MNTQENNKCIDSYVTLKDDRKLYYADFNNSNNNNQQIVLYFHGTPGYRYFLSPNQISLLSDQRYDSIRLISLDRPGWGDSDGKQGRTLLDYADDVLEFLSLMNIPSEERISIIGYSAGGPFALACATHSQLSQRLRCVIVASSLGPRSEPDSTEVCYY
jgi:pimeloyl-ACP methyl ester carboxylesterase